MARHPTNYSLIKKKTFNLSNKNCVILSKKTSVNLPNESY